MDNGWLPEGSRFRKGITFLDVQSVALYI
jgi:hypothetical protein